MSGFSFKHMSISSTLKVEITYSIKTPSGLNLVTHVSLGLKVSLKQDIRPAVTLTTL